MSAAGKQIFGLRPKSRTAWPNPETAHEKSLSPKVLFVKISKTIKLKYRIFPYPQVAVTHSRHACTQHKFARAFWTVYYFLSDNARLDLLSKKLCPEKLHKAQRRSKDVILLSIPNLWLLPLFNSYCLWLFTEHARPNFFGWRSVIQTFPSSWVTTIPVTAPFLTARDLWQTAVVAAAVEVAGVSPAQTAVLTSLIKLLWIIYQVRNANTWI